MSAVSAPMSAEDRPPFRLAVDHSAAFNQGAGIGRYARNILPRATDHLDGATITLWYAPSQPGPAPFGSEATSSFDDQETPRVRRGPLSRRRMDQLWFRARVPLPFRALAGASDLIYSPDFTAPPDWHTPRIVTVHDLAFLVCPERAPAPLRTYLSAVVPRQVASAAHVTAVSQATRSDLIDRLGVDPARISVVPNGVDERFFAGRPLDAATRQTLGLPASYLLTVGTLEPRKNHLTLFAAFALLGDRLDVPLVVAGRPGWEYEPILRAAAPLRARGRVILLDYVPDDLLPGLYAGAAAVVYPSWYEGFGLPVLEGLAAGVPVVAGDVPALHEVAGDAAVFAPPASVEALADAIDRALASDQRTEHARRRRQSRARRYSWGDAGRILAAIIAGTAGRPDLLVSAVAP
jgi:glycosyltransferase involved in cell wall biosynthesis